MTIYKAIAVIEFINASSNTYKGMKKNYKLYKEAFKGIRTFNWRKRLFTDTSYEEFVMTKQNFNKEKVRQFIHFIQSFSPNDKATLEIISEIGKKLLEHKVLKDFQVLYAIHYR